MTEEFEMAIVGVLRLKQVQLSTKFEKDFGVILRDSWHIFVFHSLISISRRAFVLRRFIGQK